MAGGLIKHGDNFTF